MFKHINNKMIKNEYKIDSRVKKLAFLSQKTVMKHIHVTEIGEDRREIAVIFGHCNSDILKHDLYFHGSIFKIT